MAIRPSQQTMTFTNADLYFVDANFYSSQSFYKILAIADGTFLTNTYSGTDTM